MNITATSSDYPDWLHPALVKDLRSSTKGVLFSTLLLCVSLGMAGIVGTLLGAMTLGLDQDSFVSDVQAAFLGGTVFVLHGLIPFRRLLTGDADSRRGNAELICLTGGQKRIVVAKLASTLLLAILCAFVILPFGLVMGLVTDKSLAWTASWAFWLLVGSAISACWGVAAGLAPPRIRLVLGCLALFVGIPIMEACVWFSVHSTLEGQWLQTAFIWANAGIVMTVLPLAIAQGEIGIRVAKGPISGDYPVA